MGSWFLGYIIGLNYTHFNQGFLKDFSVSVDRMRNWGPGLWIFFTLVMFYYWGTLFFAASCFISVGQGLFQLSIIFLVMSPTFIISFLIRETHFFHFHHYVFAVYAIPCLWFPHWYIIFNAGFSSGVIVEGLARWGADPLWIRI